MANWKLGKIQFGFLETATSGGTLTLVGSSKQYQVFTGSTTHTVKFPDATTMGTGLSFVVENNSTGAISVILNDNSVLATVAASSTIEFLLTNNGSTNGTWRAFSSGTASNGGIGSFGPGAAKTANYTVISGDTGKVIAVDTSSNVVAITLPSPLSGFNITIKDIGGNAEINPITIARSTVLLTIDNEVNDDIINKSFNSISYISDGTNWFRISGLSSFQAGRGVFAGGTTGGGGGNNTIDYVTIATAANALNFGQLTVARNFISACSSATRGVFGPAETGNNTGYGTAIDYVTIATTGNAISFASASVTYGRASGCSSSTRGLFNGGFNGTSNTNNIDYITIASLTNALNFGTLTVSRNVSSSLASPTRGVTGGGDAGGGGGTPNNTIDYVTIATLGNSTSFGVLTTVRDGMGGCASATRGVWAGGEGPSFANQNLIEYITITTTANSVSFGTLAAAKGILGACSSSTIGVFAAGIISSAVATIEEVHLATLGNATSFGNLTVARYGLAGCSNVHGGLT